MRAKARAAIEKAAALENYGHHGHRGGLREILAQELIAPVLPPSVNVGTGQVVTASGAASGQMDLVLYAPSIMPAALFDERAGYFPVEGVLYGVEVKSRLTHKGLASAIKGAQSLRDLPSMNTRHIAPTPSGLPDQNPAPIVVPLRALFAFASDLVGDGRQEVERYRELDPEADTAPAIEVICIVGRGYWTFHEGRWKSQQSTDELDEVLTFLGGTANTIPLLLAGKGQPQFGLYLQPEGRNLVEV